MSVAATLVQWSIMHLLRTWPSKYPSKFLMRCNPMNHNIIQPYINRTVSNKLYCSRNSIMDVKSSNEKNVKILTRNLFTRTCWTIFSMDSLWEKRRRQTRLKPFMPANGCKELLFPRFAIIRHHRGACGSEGDRAFVSHHTLQCARRCKAHPTHQPLMVLCEY